MIKKNSDTGRELLRNVFGLISLRLLEQMMASFDACADSAEYQTQTFRLTEHNNYRSFSSPIPLGLTVININIAKLLDFPA